MDQYLFGDIKLSENMVKLRHHAGLTQEQVAARLQVMGINISRSRLSMIELGRLNVPVEMLVAMKNIYKCRYEDFFLGLEEKLLDKQ